MRYIKSFQNDAAIQAAVDNGSLGKPYVAYNESAGTIDWNEKDINYAGMYFTIEALEDGRIRIYGDTSYTTYYSINGGEWYRGSSSHNIWVSAGDKVRFKGSYGGYGLFTGNTLSIKAYGNIESLEYGDNFENQTINNYSFMSMFKGCTGLLSVENLVLPATTLARQTYDGMFRSCTGITKAPVLPATEPAERGYQGMFDGCQNLNYVKCMLTDIQPSNPWGPTTASWLSGVSATGTFVKNASMNDWPTGNSGIPSGWTVINA